MELWLATHLCSNFIVGNTETKSKEASSHGIHIAKGGTATRPCRNTIQTPRSLPTHTVKMCLAMQGSFWGKFLGDSIENSFVGLKPNFRAPSCCCPNLSSWWQLLVHLTAYPGPCSGVHSKTTPLLAPAHHPSLVFFWALILPVHHTCYLFLPWLVSWRKPGLFPLFSVILGRDWASSTDGAAGKGPNFTVSSVCSVLWVWRYDLAYKFNMNNTTLFYTKSDLENHTFTCFSLSGTSNEWEH